MNNASPIENNPEQIMEELVRALESKLPPDVMEDWVCRFSIEKIKGDKLSIVCHGNEDVGEFKTMYGPIFEFEASKVCRRIVEVSYRNEQGESKADKAHEKRAGKKTSMLVAIGIHLLSLILLFCVFAVLVTAFSFAKNLSFNEAFYSISLPSTENNIRIIALSDLHGASYGKNNETLTERISALKPDIILLCGDIFDDDAKRPQTLGLLESLAQTAPTYMVYGNNEAEAVYGDMSLEALDEKYGFSDDFREPGELIAQDDPLENEIEKTGVLLLKNESALITVGNTEVEIFGVLTSNPSAFYQYAGDAFSDYAYENTDRIKVMLCHEPTLFEIYPTESFGDLIISGHTHGGLIRLPYFGGIYTQDGGILAEARGHYVYGKYSLSGSALLVTSGLTNGLPVRINNKPEFIVADISKY